MEETGIGRAEASRDVTALTAMLEDPAPEVRIAAAEVLGRIGGDKARLALVSLARKRFMERPDVRLAALRAAGGTLTPERYAELLEEFIGEENRKVVAGARALLAEADPDGYAARLVSRGCTDHGAINVYGKSREASAVPLLRGFLDERLRAGDLTSGSTWGKAYAAIKALGAIGGPDAAEALGLFTAGLEEQEPSESGLLSREKLARMEEAAAEAIRMTVSDI